MTTTAVFAEILVAGLGALVWLLMLVLAMFPSTTLRVDSLQEWGALLTLVVAAGAYVLGVAVDRTADSAWDAFSRTPVGSWVNRQFGESSHWYKTPAPVSKMRLTVIKESENLAKFLDYQRSRLRVARATALNLAASLPAAIMYLTTRIDAGPVGVVTVVFLLLVAFGVSVSVSERIRSAYIHRLSDAYTLLKPDMEDEARNDANVDPCPEGAKDEVVAAVPYSLRGRDIRLLIVRTKDGTRWTFPKGHVERDETQREAAQREAREEAGAVGKSQKSPLTHYLYPRSSRGALNEESYCVRVYLLEVTREEEPKDGRDVRTPEWVTVPEARRRLVLRRSRKYAREHRRVLRIAVRALRTGR